MFQTGVGFIKLPAKFQSADGQFLTQILSKPQHKGTLKVVFNVIMNFMSTEN